jgi:DNA (cytosine-5)-methyltransferase 1
MPIELKTGSWLLKDIDKIPKNGLSVFSCFHCGGGSTMGYKLAGFEVLGGVEIDKEMMDVYRQNHHPKYSYLMGVQEFKNIPNDKLPPELFDLDILDGSPPCSSFSMAGSREKKWGKNTHFREGQTEQVLDDLFFHYIDIAKKLQPKVAIAENVRGLIQGNARGYVKQIFTQFRDVGYDCQLFLLNAATMGVPQKRERTFFIANRIKKRIIFNFNEKIITAGKAIDGSEKDYAPKLRPSLENYWDRIELGKSVSSVNKSGSGFCNVKLDPRLPSNTQTASLPAMHWKEKRHLYSSESIRLQTFPDDFKCKNELKHYVCGMSVPPFMMQRIANQIAIQFFKKNIDEVGVSTP